MNILEQIRQKNPSLRKAPDDEIKSMIRSSPEFNGMNERQFDQFVTGSWGDQAEDGGDKTPGFVGGVSAGIDQIQGMGGGLLMAAGDAFESDAAWETGRDMYQRNMEEAGENDLGYGFTDIRGVGDAFNWARYTAGNLIPTLAVSVAGGGIGGVGARMLAGQAAKAAATKAGAAAGTYAASSGMGIGEIMGETEDLDVSLAHGSLYGAVDALVPFKILRKVGGKEMADKAVGEISEGVMRDLQKTAGRSAKGAFGRGSLTTALTEAPTEGLQGLIGQHANYWVENNGESLLNNMGEVNYKAFIDEMAAGGLMGPAIGGPTGLIERGRAKSQLENIEQARKQAAEAGGDPLDQTMAAQQAEAETPDYSPTPSEMPGDMDAPLDIPDRYQPKPLSEQVGTEQTSNVVYQQDGVTITRDGDTQFTATDEQSGLQAFGADAGEARRRLVQLAERNQPQAPVLQNRDRSDPGYIQQMEAIANNPDYDQVSASKTPDAGAPMVFAQGNAPLVGETDAGRQETITMADGQGNTRKIRAQYAVVEADQLKASHRADGSQNAEYGRDGLIALNNGRTAGLQEAYNRGTAEDYRQNLRDDAQTLGIDPAAIDSKQSPVLVRLFDGAQLEGIDDPGAASNERLSADLSPSEQAQTDARRINPDVLASLQPGDPTGANNADFVRSALSAIAGDNRKTDLRDRNGLLTAAGQKRIRSALVERAYSDETLTQELAEATDNDLKTLGDALTESAGRWALMRERAREGSINPDMDITDALVSAVNMIRKSRQEGQSLRDIAGQIDAFAGEADQMAVQMLHLFYHGSGLKRIRAKDTITGALQGYIDSALQSSPAPDMFGEMATPQNTLEVQRGQIEGTQPQAAAPGVQPDGRDAGEAGQAGARPRSDQSGQENAGEGRGEAEAVAPEQEAPDLDLQAQTEQDLAEQEQQRQQAEQEEAQQRREAEQRDQADAEADDFLLTGSDSQIDQAEARGQGNMFDGEAQANEPGTEQEAGDLPNGNRDQARADTGEPAQGSGEALRGDGAQNSEVVEADQETPEQAMARMYQRQVDDGKAPEIADWLQDENDQLKAQRIPTREIGSGRVAYAVVDHTGTRLAQSGTYVSSEKGATKAAKAEASSIMDALDIVRDSQQEASANDQAKSESKPDQGAVKQEQASEPEPAIVPKEWQGVAGKAQQRDYVSPEDVARQFDRQEGPFNEEGGVSIAPTEQQVQEQIDSLKKARLGKAAESNAIESQSDKLGELLGEAHGLMAQALTLSKMARRKENLPESSPDVAKAETKEWNSAMGKAKDKYAEAQDVSSFIEALKRRSGEEISGNETPAEAADAEIPETAEGAGSPVAPIESGIEASEQLESSLNNGEAVTADDVRRAFDYIASNPDSVRAELNKLTKAQLKKKYNGFAYSDTKKAEMVERVYQDMITRFRFIGSDGVIRGAGYGLDNAIEKARDHVESLTDAQIAEYATERKAAIDERKAQITKTLDRIQNPETLEDFREAVRVKGVDSLTPEQRATYDRLLAENTMAQRQPETTREGLQTDEQVETGEPVEGVHGKTGETIYNVKAITRLSKDKFKEAAKFARSMGGGYWRGNFYFKTVEDAEQFRTWVNGESVDVSERASQRQEQKQEQSADRLKAMADRLEQQAETDLNAERKENTAKRMREADSARANAAGDARMASILRRVAESDSPVLKGMTQKVQVELLDKLTRTLKYNASRDLVETGRDGNLSFKSDVTDEAKVADARMPIVDMPVAMARDLAKDMRQVRGFVRQAQRLESMSKLAKDNQITLGETLANKVVEYADKHAGKYETIKEAAADYKRLQRMGITNKPTLRAALLEFMQVSQGAATPTEQNRLQTLERDLQRTMVGNRGAFNDFFPTPESVSAEVVSQAEIEPGMRVLEPSAGNGMLADAAKEAGAEVDVVEMGGQLREILKEKGYNLVGDDFLDYRADQPYDRIVMNPPFSRDQDIQHVEHAYSMLKPGGKLAAIVSSMAGDRANNRNRQFRSWLDSVDSVEQPLPEGAFLSSMNQTGVNTKIVVIDKPADAQVEAEATENPVSEGDNTVTAQGVTVQVPVIDEQLIEDFNRATYVASSRDLNAELRGTAESTLNDLAEKQHTLVTAEQKAETKRLIEAYLEKSAEFARWDASHNARNPSWIVTGRSNRNMDKANKRTEKHMDEYVERVDRLEAQRKRIAKTLYDMRPESVKDEQAVSADKRRIAELIGAIAGDMVESKSELAKSNRKWASPKAHKVISDALERNRAATIGHLQEIQATKMVTDAGGLAKILGPRSKAAKLVTELLDDVPAFMRTQGATARGLSEARVQATVDSFLSEYSGAADVTVKIHDNATTLPGYDPARDGRAKIAGQYVSKTDTVHLVRTAFDSESAVTEALQEEILVHKGLGFFAPEDRQQLYRDIQQAAEQSPEVKALWDKTVHEYKPVAQAVNLNEDQADRLYAEELLGTLAQERPNWMKKGWRTLWRGIKQLLVKAGWIEPSIGANDLRSRIDLIADAFRRGRQASLRDFTSDIKQNKRQPENAGASDSASPGARYKLGGEARAQELTDAIQKATQGVTELEGTRVVGTTSDLPAKARAEIERQGVNPSSVRGLYVDGELYVVSENVATVQEGIEVAVHEAVGHKGIRGVLGKDLDSVMLRLYRTLPNSPEGRAALAEVKRDYPFLDTGKREDRIAIGEEMVAHLLEKGQRPKAWQRAVSKIRELLRKLIPSVAWTYTDVLALGEQSREHLRRRKAGAGDKAMRYSIGAKERISGGSLFNDFTETDRAAAAKMGPRSAPRRVMDAWKEATNNAGLKIRQGMVDRLAAFKAMDEQLLGERMLNEDITRSSWVLGRMANAANGALHAMLHNGRLAMDASEKVIGLKDDDSKGLGSVFAQLASHNDPDSASAEVQRFMGWIAGNRARKLQEQGRENLFTEEEIGAMENWDRGELADGRNRADTYAEVFEQFQAYRDDVLAIADQAGLLRKGMEESDALLFMAQKHGVREDLVKKAKKAMKAERMADDEDVRLMADERAGAALNELQESLETELGAEAFNAEYDEVTTDQRELWANEFYVPFYRISEDEQKPSGQLSTNGLSRQQAYKRLKGGSQNLNDLLENTMMNFHHLIDASLKNQAAQQAVENAQKLGMARQVPESNRNTKTSTFILKDGEKVFYEIDDPLVFESLTALSNAGMNNTAMKVMRGFKRVFTNMTTTTPQFMVANLIRDSLQATATNEVSKNVFANVVGGAKSYKDQKVRAQMMASGASFNFGHLFGSNPDELRAQLTRDMRGAKLIDGPTAVPDALAKGWAWWNDVNNAAENVNRAAIYQQNQEKGRLKAAFESRDLIDFSAHGAWPAVRILIDIVPFLNARIQGLDKIYRSGVKPGANVLKSIFGGDDANVSDKQAAGRFWSVAGALSLATVALYLHNYDDEEYQKLEDWQKDTYWFIRFGDQAFFIPKPFEVGAIATMAERITEQFMDDQATGKLFRERMMHMMTDTFSFSPVPQAVQPVLDIYANYDAFTQRPIESMGMDRLSPELRKRSSTSKAGEWISMGLNNTLGAIGNPETNPLALSPVQVDHLIGGYLGQVGTWVAGSGDVAWNVASGKESPAQKWYEYQPVRRFYSNLGDEDRYTKYGTVFYEGLREAGRAYADVKELRELGRLEDAAEVAESSRDMLKLRKSLNRAQSRLREVNKRIDLIRRSNIDGQLKRQKIDRLRTVKNRIQEVLAKQVMEARAQ